MNRLIFLINIVCLWAFVLYLLHMIGQSKYGLWRSYMRKWLHRDDTGFDYLNQNKQYYVCYILTPLISYLSLTLLSQLDIGLPHIRTEIVAITSACVWVGLFFLTKYLNQAVRKNEPRS